MHLPTLRVQKQLKICCKITEYDEEDELWQNCSDCGLKRCDVDTLKCLWGS